MEEKMDTEKVISDGMEVPEENPSAPEEMTTEAAAPEAPASFAEEPSTAEGTAFAGTTATEGTTGTETFTTEGPNGEEPPEEVKKKTFLRACGSWTDIIPIAAMLSFILINLGGIASWILDGTLIPAREIGMRLLGDADSVEFLLQYFEFYGIWLVFMLVILLFRDNWPMWKAFLYNRHGNNLKAIPAGILLVVFLLCVMIQSGAEEIIDRCYLYQKLRRRYRWPIIAVLVNSLVFMAMHMLNPGVTRLGLLQVFLIGVLFSLIIYYWDSLWTVIWAHTAWNFSQSIVFGLPNSGIVSKFSVFKLEAASARDGIFYNTSFGVEGSMGANAIIAGVIVIVLIYGLVTKRGEMADHWEEMERRDTGKNHIWEAVVLTVIMAAIIGLFALGGLWLRDHSDEVQQFLQEVQEEQAIQQEQEGQQPGQGTTPDQSQQPGQEVTPDQSQQPGQETTPDQSEQPGQEVTPDQNAQPGQDGGQTQEMQPQNT